MALVCDRNEISPNSAFQWLPDQSRKRRRSRIRKLQWPPRTGQKIAFRSDFGIEMGILREIEEGLVCRQFTMVDGQIVMEHQLVMSPEATPWRHPDSVTKEEWGACVQRIKQAHDAAPDTDPRQIPKLWADFCQFTAYLAIKVEVDNERKKAAMMEINPNIPPN